MRLGGAAVAVGALVAGIGGPAYASAASQVPAGSTGFFGGFSDVTAVSATDGWAVGGNGTTGVVQRFNGTRWSVFPTPDLLGQGANSSAALSGVDATSAGNAFAVGNATSSSTGAHIGVALRWNGSAWSRLTVPSTSTETAFTAVKAFSANDAWAVGGTTASANSSRTTVAMHFNGAAWSPTPIPSPGTKDNILTSVDGSAPNDVWAVGFLHNLPYGNRIRLPMIMHWNGSAWTQVPSPGAADHSTYLYDVAAVSATDAWAVGYDTSTPDGAFVARWNGTAWNAAPAPALGSLSSVAARSGNDVWVTGSDANGAPAAAHWNGSGWTVTPLTVTGGVGMPLVNSVAVVDANTEWAAGSQWEPTTGQSAPIAFRIVG